MVLWAYALGLRLGGAKEQTVMIVTVKVILALVGFGLGLLTVLWVYSGAAKSVKHLGTCLEVGVFLLAVSVVVDASFRGIGPGGRGAPLFYWALWGSLIGVFVSGLVLFICHLLRLMFHS